MWIIQKNAVSNEQQDKVQELQISFRSGEKTYSVLINKSMEFSQSLLRVSIGADTIPKTKYQPIADILRISPKRATCDIIRYHKMFHL
jgi:type III secretion system FlhB-like substrate exporter